MKKIVFLSIMALMVLLNTSCDEIEYGNKEIAPTMPTVENLNSSISNGVATVTWSIPSNIPNSFARPLSVSVQVYQYRLQTYNPVRVEMEALENEATSFSYTIPTDGNEYHIIVKLVGNVANPSYGTTGVVYSLGQTVVVK
jgi:hypothetical protein